MDEIKPHSDASAPKRDQSDQNHKKPDETWRRGLVRPHHDSAKTDDPRDTPTRELGDTSGGTSTFGLEWAQRQLGDFRKRPEFTVKPESTELRADARDTTDQTLLQKSKEQKILEDRRFNAPCRLFVDYNQRLPKNRVGF
jgi:hypothetical protein